MKSVTFSSSFSAVLGLVGLAIAGSSHAVGAVAQVDVQGGPSQQYTASIGTLVVLPVAQLSGSSGASTASAYASMSTGVLKDTAHATNAYPGTPYAASASSSIYDTVTFSGGIGQTGFLDYSFEGSLTLNPLINTPYATYGQMLVYIGSAFANLQLSAFQGNCGGGSLFASCTVGTSVSKQGSIPFTITAGQMSFGAGLSAYAQFGNTAEFSNTGKLYLRAPGGVTFASTTGNFLSAAAPIFTSAVPEPSSYALLLAGLATIGLAIQRKRRTD